LAFYRIQIGMVRMYSPGWACWQNLSQEPLVRKADYKSTWLLSSAITANQKRATLLNHAVRTAHFQLTEDPLATLIGPLLDSRPLPHSPLPDAIFGSMRKKAGGSKKGVARLLPNATKAPKNRP
jgi:hypothetical protein